MRQGDLVAWTCARTEWVLAVMARWVTDIRARRVMFRLKPRLVEAIDKIGVEVLVRHSDVTEPQVAMWLKLHRRYPWGGPYLPLQRG